MTMLNKKIKYYVDSVVKLMLTISISVLCCGASFAEHNVSELDKLFTDKRQRANIDAKRSGNVSPELQKTNKVTIDGYVTRSDGKDVVWINNGNTLDSYKVGDVKVQQLNIGKDKKVGVTLDGTHVHLKAGETWSEGVGISDVGH